MAGGGAIPKEDPMMQRELACLAVLGMLAALCARPAMAAEEPKAFACSFPAGITNSYDQGRYAAEKAAPFAFAIAGIDAVAQTAEIRTDRGSAPLRVVQAVNAIHFLEAASEGFLNVTTIYDKDEAKGAHPAVHSRHFAILGQPVVTQYQGFCEAKG
jgi:hypothetical protein